MLLFLIVLKEKNVVAERNVSDSIIYIMPQPCRNGFQITYETKWFSLQSVERLTWDSSGVM